MRAVLPGRGYYNFYQWQETVAEDEENSHVGRVLRLDVEGVSIPRQPSCLANLIPSVMSRLDRIVALVERDPLLRGGMELDGAISGTTSTMTEVVARV